jgi:response regulator RpfG family c-di-GMP phosphodiesterase
MRRLNDFHTVVVVDDDPSVLWALWRSLRQEPYQILTTDRPEEALDWVRHRPVSLVISDQRMPEMEGTDLLEEVAKDSPATARVILTAYPESTALLPGLRKRIDCLVTKPWDVTLLRRTIRDILNDLELEQKSEEDERGP